MKLHRHLVEAVASSLFDIFSEGYYADKVIERHLKNNKRWGARDRRFYAETTYEIVRWWRRLWFAMGEEPRLEPEPLFRLVGVWCAQHADALPQWAEWAGLKPLVIRARYDEAAPLAIHESVPDWIEQRLTAELPDKMPDLLTQLNHVAPVFLRTNRLLTTREQLREFLLQEGVETKDADDHDALVLIERKNVFQTDCFQKGFFEVQDLHSQRVAPLLNLEPGLRVIDACAGAGGKTLHIATLMRNKGRVIALDIYPRKLEELSKRTRRAHVDIVETRAIESTKTIKRLHESADRVLLDVPCSGLGVLRRNPDSKWKLQPEKCDELVALQAQLLRQYSPMLKAKGQMVYATCSILPSENQKQVAHFLAEHPTWRLDEEHALFPQARGGDGFYMARLIRA